MSLFDPHETTNAYSVPCLWRTTLQEGIIFTFM